MKRNIILAALLASTVVTSSLAVPPHTGFSIGAHLGATQTDGKLNRSFGAPNASDRSDFGARSPSGGLFLGYGWSPMHTPRFYLGAEVFGQLESINAKREDLLPFVNFSMQLRSNNTFGGVVKIGHVCKDALFFLKLGAASTKWRLSFTDLNPPALTVQTNTRRTGFVAGLGMDYAIAKNWAVGGEFLYTTYQSLKLTIGSGINGAFNYKPKVGTVNLRLRYTF